MGKRKKKRPDYEALIEEGRRHLYELEKRKQRYKKKGYTVAKCHSFLNIVYQQMAIFALVMELEQSRQSEKGGKV